MSDRCTEHIGYRGEHKGDCPWCQIATLRADCKTMAESVLSHHEQPCTGKDCTTARKYTEEGA